ncbi:hypothetical protein EB061_12080, partial [bacterium]|nr:hypothetical protein [bacterium]
MLDFEADPLTGVYRFLDESGRRQKGRTEYGQRLRQLSEQIRGGDEVPWPTRDATPPEDMASVAETQGKAAAALVQLSAAATANPLMGAAIARIDLPRYLERYFPMQAQDESGVQLQDRRRLLLAQAAGISLSLSDEEIEEIEAAGVEGVYAEPGKAIDFKSLKATAGGQKSTTSQRDKAAKDYEEHDKAFRKALKERDDAEAEDIKGVTGGVKHSERWHRAEARAKAAFERMEASREAAGIEAPEYRTSAKYARMLRADALHEAVKVKPTKKVIKENEKKANSLAKAIRENGIGKSGGKPVREIEDDFGVTVSIRKAYPDLFELSDEERQDVSFLLRDPDPTNFPTQGDSKAVSLRNSAYPVFDAAYIDDIKENWPDIWNAGGNDVEGTEHSGDDQYRRLRPVVARGGSPETDTEEQAIRRREAWAARH